MAERKSKKKSLRILCSNDDGIHAPGLAVLETIAHALSDDVWVVAPETEQSGASHSLTLHAPLRLRDAGKNRWAVQGTPTDCVMLAIKEIMSRHPPDLVLSGVNLGANMAEDVTYSGTIAAAMEGTILGVPSIALSQRYGPAGRTDVNWRCAETHGPRIIRALLNEGWPQNVLMNVNFPHADPKSVKSVEITRQGSRDQQTALIERRDDLRGGKYYWIGFRRTAGAPAPGTDLHAVYNGRISITPLHMDLTETAMLERLKSLDW